MKPIYLALSNIICYSSLFACEKCEKIEHNLNVNIYRISHEIDENWYDEEWKCEQLKIYADLRLEFFGY